MKNDGIVSSYFSIAMYIHSISTANPNSLSQTAMYRNSEKRYYLKPLEPKPDRRVLRNRSCNVESESFTVCLFQDENTDFRLASKLKR